MPQVTPTQGPAASPASLKTAVDDFLSTATQGVSVPSTDTLVLTPAEPSKAEPAAASAPLYVAPELKAKYADWQQTQNPENIRLLEGLVKQGGEKGSPLFGQRDLVGYWATPKGASATQRELKDVAFKESWVQGQLLKEMRGDATYQDKGFQEFRAGRIQELNKVFDLNERDCKERTGKSLREFTLTVAEMRPELFVSEEERADLNISKGTEISDKIKGIYPNADRKFELEVAAAVEDSTRKNNGVLNPHAAEDAIYRVFKKTNPALYHKQNDPKSEQARKDLMAQIRSSGLVADFGERLAVSTSRADYMRAGVNIPEVPKLSEENKMKLAEAKQAMEKGVEVRFEEDPAIVAQKMKAAEEAYKAAEQEAKEEQREINFVGKATAKSIANEIQKAIKGWGTHEGLLEGSLNKIKTKAGWDEVVAEYQKIEGNQNRNLGDDMLNEVGGALNTRIAVKLKSLGVEVK